MRTLDTISVGKASTEWLIASGDISGWIVLREVDGERSSLVASIQGHAGAIRKVRFISHKLLATCGEDNRLRLWRVPDFTCVHEGRHDNFVTDVISISRRRLLSSGYDGNLMLHDISWL